jgi:hypothetical protein
MGRLKLGFFVVALTYSFTEAGFRNLTPIWIAFLLSVVNIPALRTAAVERPRLAVEPAAESKADIAVVVREPLVASRMFQ